jgi:hypothetical protein
VLGGNCDYNWYNRKGVCTVLSKFIMFTQRGLFLRLIMTYVSHLTQLLCSVTGGVYFINPPCGIMKLIRIITTC